MGSAFLDIQVKGIENHNVGRIVHSHTQVSIEGNFVIGRLDCKDGPFRELLVRLSLRTDKVVNRHPNISAVVAGADRNRAHHS